MKTFILDTNVLIHDPEAYLNFKNSQVVIPMTVIEELDTFKRSNDERGRSARLISRKLDILRRQGKITEGIKLPNGATLTITLDEPTSLSYNFVTNKADHRILGTALNLKQKGYTVVFITKDINLRLKAEALGITAEDYEKEKVVVEELYSGLEEINISGDKIDEFYQKKKLVIPEKNFYPNEGIILHDSANPKKSALGKYSAKEKCVLALYHQNIFPWGVKPLNVEQRLALELLMSNEISLVTLIGVPGAGKTLLALACGLQKVVEEKVYRRLFIARPIIPLGRDIGYLPGSKEEKLSSWMGAIYDNLEFLLDKPESPNFASSPTRLEDKLAYLFDSGKIEIEALTYIRGRSLPQQYIIIDDAQNLTPHEIKTIISRAGEGTKIVLTGDPYQIDNPYLDASSNGLSYIVERFKGQTIYGHLTFTKSERSQLAALAAELL